MALEDILFSQGTVEGQPFVVEMNVTSTGAASDIGTGNRSGDDALVNELYLATVVVDNRRRVR